MDPRDRVMDAFDGCTHGIPPVAMFTQSATVGMMDVCGASWPDAHFDAGLMATLGCAQAKVFGFCTARVPFDITAEAERLGCAVSPGTKDNVLGILSRAVAGNPLDGKLPEIDLMSPEEFVSGGRPATVTEAIRLCSRDIGDSHAIVSGILGPVTLLGQLMGAENMVLATLMEPAWTARMCSELSGILTRYAVAQKEAGADILTIVEAVASPDVLDPKDYRRLSGSHTPDIRPKGMRAVLHICGSTEPILEDISGSGLDAFSPDPKVSPSLVRETLGDMTVCGAVDPVGTLLFGDPAKVVSEARAYSDEGYDIIAPGCGLAPRTPDDNLRALADAFRRREPKNEIPHPHSR